MSDVAGPRRPTIRDVATRAGVSKSLVALVYASPARVSPERTRRVLAAAEELGFRPNMVARSLARAADFVVILVADLHNPLFPDIVVAAQGALAAAGVPSLISAVAGAGAHRADDMALTLLHDLRPSGVLVVGSVPDLGAIATLAESGVRLVLASALATGAGIATVRGDDEAGIALAVGHLTGAGHRRIAFVGGQGGAVAELRREAFVAAMRDAGLTAEAQVRGAAFSEREGRDAAAGLLEGAGPRPTAVVAANDQIAVGVLAAAADRGARLAVTGYDNSSLAGLPQVSLTSVEPGNAEIGRLCAAQLRSAAPHDVLVTPRLIVRSSTGRS